MRYFWHIFYNVWVIAHAHKIVDVNWWYGSSSRAIHEVFYGNGYLRNNFHEGHFSCKVATEILHLLIYFPILWQWHVPL